MCFNSNETDICVIDSIFCVNDQQKVYMRVYPPRAPNAPPVGELLSQLEFVQMVSTSYFTACGKGINTSTIRYGYLSLLQTQCNILTNIYHLFGLIIFPTKR